MAFAPIAQDVQAFSQRLGLSNDLAVIDHAWNLEIGFLRGRARILAIDHASLVVEVESHTVMQGISLRRRELLRKLNKHLSAPILKHMSIRMSQTHVR